MDIVKKIAARMALSGTKQRALEYPEPYIVPPRSGEHRQSFIVLHGRGSNGEQFGRHLLMTPVTGFNTLQEAFPHGKFVFPTASKRRAVVLGRSMVHQWFDLWSIKEQTKNEEVQFDGLRESSQHVHQLLKGEIAAVGADNVVLWGLSQGMATSMISLLLWTGPEFAAAVGMCGWVPLKARMEREVRDEADLEGEENPFKGNEPKPSKSIVGEETSERHAILQKAAYYLREELQLSGDQKSLTTLEIPIFVGHGTKDEKVPTVLGEEAVKFLRSLEFNVEFQKYEGLGHWYNPDMLRDIILFLQCKTGVQPDEPVERFQADPDCRPE